MPIQSPLTGLASSIHRRLTGRGRRPEDAPQPDPFTEDVRAYLHARILARYTRPDKYMANDINHIRRFVTSLMWIPEGVGRVIDPASGGGLFPDLLRHFRGCEVEVPDFFNLEKEPAPYPDAAFDGVVLMEVLEHFIVDPMYAMSELNRILQPGGFLLLTTPNLASWVSLHNLINYETPYIYGLFERHHCPDRHNREYTIHEVGKLAEAAGFRVERLEGITVYPDHDVVGPIPGINPNNRGDTTFLFARKEGPVRDRYPAWLYANWSSD
jgi:SAM-dependent methyltransferase